VKKLAWLHVCLIGIALLSTGCWSVAAGVAGGTILACGSYVVGDEFENAVPVPLDRMQAVTRAALKELSVDVLQETLGYSGEQMTRCDIQAIVLGDEPINVDVELIAISPRLTRVVAHCNRSWNMPDRTTAEAIVKRITAMVKEDIHTARLTTGPPLGG
jgi:hypothetical protein